MKQTKIIMDMPITVEVVDSSVKTKDIAKVFDYFTYIDEKFSTFKDTSEITKINKGMLAKSYYSQDMKKVLELCDKTKKETLGYFDIERNGRLNPSGIVKGFAIDNAARLLKKMAFKNFYVDAGGDIQVSGKNKKGKAWRVGIRNPFNRNENIKIVSVNEEGVATSGTSIRGQHIYNPYKPEEEITDIVSLTVIGPNIYEADRFATAAFAMGEHGINFIENLKSFEGYMIDRYGVVTMTTGFESYVIN